MNVNNLDKMNIGYVGENDVTSVEFDFSDWEAAYGPGIISLVIKRPMDSVPYPVVLTVTGTKAVWEVSSTDIAYFGYGQGQLVYTVDTQIKKSAVFSFMVRPSITGDPVPPDPFDSWIDDLTQLGSYTLQNVQDAQAAANAAEGSAQDSEAWAVGQRDGTDVESDDPAYENNAKYYAGQAKAKADEITELTVSATTLEAGDPATVSYEDGHMTFGIPEGAKGDPGDPGTPGTDGITPDLSIGTVATGAAGSDASVTITGTKESPVLNFTIPRGDTGEVDTAIIAPDYSDLTFPVTAGTYCTHEGDLFVAKQDIASSESWTSAHWDQTDVGGEISSLKDDLNGKLDAPETAGTSGQVLTSDGDGGQTWETPSTPTIPVTDVQIEGTSILNQGVANVPVGAVNVLGAVSVDSYYGINANSSGRLYVSAAPTDRIKAGTETYAPVVASNQHESTFYGLAKAAGDTTQSASSNAVGTYTDDAKRKICKMLGIPYFKAELINEYTVPEDTDEVVISTDSNGESFELIKAKIVVTINNLSANSYFLASYYAKTIQQDGIYSYINFATIWYQTSSNRMTYYLDVIGGLEFNLTARGKLNSTGESFGTFGNTGLMSPMERFRLKQYSSTSSLITAGTKIYIYGIRA